VRRKRDHSLAAQRIRDYLVPSIGHLLLGRVSGEGVRRYRLWLEKKELSVQSVRHILSDLRCLLNWCESSGLLERSTFPKKVMPRVQERPPDRLTDEEAEAVARFPTPTGSAAGF
jgi:site-specific recombinase XerD